MNLLSIRSDWWSCGQKVWCYLLGYVEIWYETNGSKQTATKISSSSFIAQAKFPIQLSEHFFQCKLIYVLCDSTQCVRFLSRMELLFPVSNKGVTFFFSDMKHGIKKAITIVFRQLDAPNELQKFPQKIPDTIKLPKLKLLKRIWFTM